MLPKRLHLQVPPIHHSTTPSLHPPVPLPAPAFRPDEDLEISLWLPSHELPDFLDAFTFTRRLLPLRVRQPFTSDVFAAGIIRAYVARPANRNLTQPHALPSDLDALIKYVTPNYLRVSQ